MNQRLWKKVWEVDRMDEFPIYLLGTMDIALRDITSKVAEVPLYQLLGGYRDRIPAYASTVTFGSIEEYLEVADQCLGLGYSAMKLHAWGEVRRDAERARRLRDDPGKPHRTDG